LDPPFHRGGGISNAFKREAKTDLLVIVLLLLQVLPRVLLRMRRGRSERHLRAARRDVARSFTLAAAYSEFRCSELPSCIGRCAERPSCASTPRHRPDS
jgi:hypothetical protein